MVSFLLAIIYVAFISLGLPDSILGSVWPVMHESLGVAVSSQGILSMVISVGTIISSVYSSFFIQKFGTGKVTAISVGMTALALFGFSVSGSFWMLCLWAVPYGLGAGSVDAALNNFVALHYKAHHMNWLHCFWGLGATLGPYIMGMCLSGGMTWPAGYRVISALQIALTAVLVFSLPLWKRVEHTQSVGTKEGMHSVSLREALKITGAKPILAAFFCYCAVEATTGLWGSSYFVMDRGIAVETAAKWGAVFFLGVTLGRLVSGFLSMKINEKNMIRLGQCIAFFGVTLLACSGNAFFLCAGYVLIGIGCAPIYPSMLHVTPENFGKEASQAMMGVQMACAYLGTTLIPPLFGLIAQHVSIHWYPFYLMIFIAVMFIMTEYVNRKKSKKE